MEEIVQLKDIWLITELCVCWKESIKVNHTNVTHPYSFDRATKLKWLSILDEGSLLFDFQ